MTPKQLSTKLLRIASYIDNTPNPKREEVIQELRSVVSAMKRQASPEQIFQSVMKSYADLGKALKDKNAADAVDLAGALSGWVQDWEESMAGSAK